MTTMYRHRSAWGVAAAAVLMAASCQDAFFFEPAPGLTPVTLRYTFPDAPVLPAGVPAAVGGPQASPGAAFDKADGAQVTLRSGDRELFAQRLTLESAGADRKVAFTVELPAGGAVSASLELTLLRGTDALFTGSGASQLVPGQAAEVSLQLSPVVARVDAGGPYTLRTLGGTVRVTPVGLFATGDAAGPVAPTYRALTSNVSVTGDGTVTALANGAGLVEVAFQGRADTAVVAVEDRCFAPFPQVSVGQGYSGVLESVDCDDPGNNAFNDWYELTVTEFALVRATLGANGFFPFVGLATPDKEDLAVAADQTSSVTSEYGLVPGTYLLRAGSRSQPDGPNPTGTYTLSLANAGTEPQVGCFGTPTNVGATWVDEGYVGAGRLAADDCALPNGVRQDVYAGRMGPGDTAIVTMETGFDAAFYYGNDWRRTPPGGGKVQWAFTSDDVRSHYVFLRTGASGPFGPYTVRISTDLTDPGYTPCTNSAIEMGTGTPEAPAVKQGRLQIGIDCLEGNRIRDTYVVTTPSGAFETRLETSEFEPFVAMSPRGRQGWGRASAGPTVTAEHVYAPGQRHEIRALPRPVFSAGGSHEGRYTLTVSPVAEPQAVCRGDAFVFFGSQASGHITSADCEDVNDNDPNVLRRWDGYSILLQPGETVTVRVHVDFQARFTHWIGGQFNQGVPVQAGQEATLVATNSGTTGAFHGFYVLNEIQDVGGGYFIEFSGTPAGAAERAEGSLREESPVLVHTSPMLAPGAVRR